MPAPAAIDLTGNELANTIFGNDGDNRAETAAPARTRWSARAGDDWYFVDNAGDGRRRPPARAPTGSSRASSYTLAAGAEVELMTTDFHAGTAAIDLTGNELANTIHGNAGDNKLTGGAGADTLVGLAGNDWYLRRQCRRSSCRGGRRAAMTGCSRARATRSRPAPRSR